MAIDALVDQERRAPASASSVRILESGRLGATYQDWAIFARSYEAAYREKHAEALLRGLSDAMAGYVANQHATRVAVRRSGISDPSATAYERE